MSYIPALRLTTPVKKKKKIQRFPRQQAKFVHVCSKNISDPFIPQSVLHAGALNLLNIELF